MTSSASLSGNLPQGDANGLAAIVSDLINDPQRMHVLIAIADCRKTVRDNDSGDTIPTVRLRRVEVVLRDDYGAAERLMRRALESRSGKTVLPLDLEDDVRAAFGGVEEEDAG